VQRAFKVSLVCREPLVSKARLENRVPQGLKGSPERMDCKVLRVIRVLPENKGQLGIMVLPENKVLQGSKVQQGSKVLLVSRELRATLASPVLKVKLVHRETPEHRV